MPFLKESIPASYLSMNCLSGSSTMTLLAPATIKIIIIIIQVVCSQDRYLPHCTRAYICVYLLHHEFDIALIYRLQDESIQKLKHAGANFHARVAKGLYSLFTLELNFLLAQAYEPVGFVWHWSLRDCETEMGDLIRSFFLKKLQRTP